MAQGASGASVVSGGTTLVIPSEMAARIDRLPMSWMFWEIALLVQLGWGSAASTDGIARTLYPFLWLPGHTITSFQYSTLYALQTGISILIGGYAIGWLADKIGRRRALILSSLLAAVFIWPFGYVTNFWGLVFLSVGDTLGFAGFLAVNVVYMTEITGPAVRGRVIMIAQAVAIFLLYVVMLGLVPHYWVPGHYRGYLWLMAGMNLAIAVLFAWRLPESPRWLEARGRHRRARRVVEQMEARVMKRHPVLPEPDLAPSRWWPRRRPACSPLSASSTCSSPYSCWWSWCSATAASSTATAATVSCSWPKPALQCRLRLRPDGLGRRGQHRLLYPERIVRRTDRAQIGSAPRRHLVRRRLVRRLRRAQHPGPGLLWVV